ncbi:MAG: hypothetical protein WDN67_02030 [Candidatus Moraniibacteriota bacterium]
MEKIFEFEPYLGKKESPESLDQIEKDLLQFREEIKDPNTLFSYEEVESLRSRLFDNGNFFKSNKERLFLMSDFLEELESLVIHEIINREYIEELTGYIEHRSMKRSSKRGGLPFIVLEIGAGNGRLAHFMQKQLTQNNESVRYLATDKSFSASPYGNVEILEASQALEKYHPDLVICSWMPLYTDLSPLFRKTESVQEYLLIGPEELMGTADTWGKSADKAYEEMLLEKGKDSKSSKFVERIEELKREGTKLENDGFELEFLESLGVYQVNRTDLTMPSQDYVSRTASFKRIHSQEKSL